jgi:enamine deaminase RidA (YjgF/YER057c/UK114 family)
VGWVPFGRGQRSVTPDQFHTPRRDVVVSPQWRAFYDATHIPAAVWTGNTLRLSGHTGEDVDGVFAVDVEEQIRGAFRNTASTLAEAGVRWSDVVELHSYHVGLGSQGAALLRIAAEFLQAPYPAWIAVGVVELFSPRALVEIRCIAVLEDRHP